MARVDHVVLVSFLHGAVLGWGLAMVTVLAMVALL
jgi:hypothetical protein